MTWKYAMTLNFGQFCKFKVSIWKNGALISVKYLSYYIFFAGEGVSFVSSLLLVYVILHIVFCADADIQTPFHHEERWRCCVPIDQAVRSSVCKSELEDENPGSAPFCAVRVQMWINIQLGRTEEVYENGRIPGLSCLAYSLLARKRSGVGERCSSTQDCTITLLFFIFDDTNIIWMCFFFLGNLYDITELYTCIYPIL